MQDRITALEKAVEELNTDRPASKNLFARILTPQDTTKRRESISREGEGPAAKGEMDGLEMLLERINALERNAATGNLNSGRSVTSNEEQKLQEVVKTEVELMLAEDRLKDKEFTVEEAGSVVAALEAVQKAGERVEDFEARVTEYVERTFLGPSTRNLEKFMFRQSHMSAEEADTMMEQQSKGILKVFD